MLTASISNAIEEGMNMKMKVNNTLNGGRTEKLVTNYNLSDKEVDEAIILATKDIITPMRRNRKLIKVD